MTQECPKDHPHEPHGHTAAGDWTFAQDDARVGEAVALLDALTSDDPEVAHAFADGVISSFAPAEVVTAYLNAAQRVGFWYA